MPDRRAEGRSLLAFAGNRAVTIMLALSALLLLVAVTTAIVSLREVTANSQRIEQTLRTQAAINRLAALNEQIETARRGNMLWPEADFVSLLRTTGAAFDEMLGSVETMVAGDAAQAEGVGRIRRLAAEREQYLTMAILNPATAAAVIRAEGPTRERGVLITREIRALTAQMADMEDSHLIKRNLDQARSIRWLYVVGGAASLLLTVFLGTVIVLALRYNRELAQAQADLRRSNETLEEAVADRTAELTRANAEIQRFAYIVSHDLRSPLVNVLGFTAELEQARSIIRDYLDKMFERHPALRDDQVWSAVEEDLPEALGFIRKSTEKMDRLIGSILQISRQGRRPLTPERLDMNALADGVAASLHQLAESVGAEVIVERLPPIESDRVAIEQILSNLVENALKYLSPGRPGRVEISGRKAGNKVEIAVRDNGRGIAPDDRDRVFDLFRRAGVQDKPGEGIGLANVRALVYRLGGTIHLDSVLDEGSVFTLSLPETFSAAESIA